MLGPNSCGHGGRRDVICWALGKAQYPCSTSEYVGVEPLGPRKSERNVGIVLRRILPAFAMSH